jgi:hypothetical protein
MMPIHDLTRGLPIYKAGKKFPYEWKYHSTLLQDTETRRSYFMYAHATIIEKDGTWWLFAYTDTHSLYAFSSKTPLDDWSWIVSLSIPSFPPHNFNLNQGLLSFPEIASYKESSSISRVTASRSNDSSTNSE